MQVAKRLVEVLKLGPALEPDQARLGTASAWETLYKLYKEAYFQHFATGVRRCCRLQCPCMKSVQPLQQCLLPALCHECVDAVLCNSLV